MRVLDKSEVQAILGLGGGPHDDGQRDSPLLQFLFYTRGVLVHRVLTNDLWSDW